MEVARPALLVPQLAFFLEGETERNKTQNTLAACQLLTRSTPRDSCISLRSQASRGHDGWGQHRLGRQPGPPRTAEFDPQQPCPHPPGKRTAQPPPLHHPLPPPKQKAQGRERVALTPSGAAAGTYLCRTVEPAARGATALLGERPEEPTLVALGLGPGCGERREPGAGEGRRTQPGERGRPSRHPPPTPGRTSPWRRQRWLGGSSRLHTRSGHVPARSRPRPRAAPPGGPTGCPGYCLSSTASFPFPTLPQRPLIRATRLRPTPRPLSLPHRRPDLGGRAGKT